MKNALIPALALSLIASPSLLADEPAAPAAPQAPAVSAQAAPAEKTPSAEAIINKILSLSINLQQTLESIQDKESADKAAKTLEGIQKEVQNTMGLQEKLSEEEQKKGDALMEKMEPRIERLTQKCKTEAGRVAAARYYGSPTLKDILENSDEFSGLIEPDEDEAHPAN